MDRSEILIRRCLRLGNALAVGIVGRAHQNDSWRGGGAQIKVNSGVHIYRANSVLTLGGSAPKVPPSRGLSMETTSRALGSTIGRTDVRGVLVRGRPDPELLYSVSAVVALGHAHTRL